MHSTTDAHVDFDEEREAFHTTAAEFVQREVMPAVAQARSEKSCPRGIYDRAGEAGLLGILAPETSGGGGLGDPRFGHLVVQAATRAGAVGIGLALGLHSNAAVPSVATGYTGPDKDSLLAGMADGSILVAIAGQAGGVSAEPSGSGLRLQGTARAVVNATNAAKYLIVVQVPDCGARVVLVDAEAPEVRPASQLLGASDAGCRDVVFDGVHVDQDAILAGERTAVDELVTDYALVVSALSIAGAQGALAETVAYVTERKAFGRKVAEFENTRNVLAALRAQLLATAFYHENCSKRRGLGALRVAEAGAALGGSVAVYDRAVDQGVQLHGGYGYMLEYPIAQAFADARFVGLMADAMPVLRTALLADLGL
jgi:acyl-CoA dehydrogenase